MKPKLTETEMENTLRMIARLQEEYDMCTHETLIWLINEINQFIKFLKKDRERNN